MNLTGYHFHQFDPEDDTYHTGVILDVDGPLLLVQYDPCEDCGPPTAPRSLIHFSDMLGCHLFTSRADLDAWLAWLDEPAEMSESEQARKH